MNSSFLRRWAAAARARLIDDLHTAWRMASVWIAGAGVLLIEIWNQLPGDIRASLPAPIAHTVPTLILVAVIVGRLIKQKGARDGK